MPGRKRGRGGSEVTALLVRRDGSDPVKKLGGKSLDADGSGSPTGKATGGSPTAGKGKGKTAEQKTAVANFARRRKANDGSPLGPDLISRFLAKGSKFVAGKDKASGGGFSDKELRDLVLNFLIAGRDTTACALSWTLYELLRHPAVAARVRADEERALLEQASAALLSETSGKGSHMSVDASGRMVVGISGRRMIHRMAPAIEVVSAPPCRAQ